MKPFIENTLAGTIGTIIGIVLTIGTTYLATRIETRKSEKQQIQMLVKGLEQNIKAFEDLAETLEYADSLNMIIHLHKDNLSVLPDSTLYEWSSYLLSLDLNAIDMTAARIFSSNIETWRNISSPEFIDNMGRSFSVIEMLIELNARREDAFFNQMYEVYELERNNTSKSIVEHTQRIIQLPVVDNYMHSVHEFYSRAFRGSTKLLREKLNESKQLVGLPIEEDELQITQNSIAVLPDTLQADTARIDSILQLTQ